MTSDKILSFLKENNFQNIKFCYVDINGNINYITFALEQISIEHFQNGLHFNYPSYNLDNKQYHHLVLIPDHESNAVYIDPFEEEKTAFVFCYIFDTLSQKKYFGDIRNIGKKVEKYLASRIHINCKNLELTVEFSLFNKNTTLTNIPFFLDNKIKNITNSSQEISADAIRTKIFQTIKNIGIYAVKHSRINSFTHSITFSGHNLIHIMDSFVMFKYIAQKIAKQFHNIISFMDNPINQKRSLSLHFIHNFVSKDKSIFSGEEYAALSEKAFSYIGGIVKNLKSINAFIHPTCNFYKNQYFSSKEYILSHYMENSLFCIPSLQFLSGDICFSSISPNSNIYLAISAIILAGIHNIESNQQLEKHNSFTKEYIKKYTSQTLKESITTLHNNHSFLTVQNIFTQEFITEYITIKTKEIEAYYNKINDTDYTMYLDM